MHVVLCFKYCVDKSTRFICNSHCRNTARKQFRFSDIMKHLIESVKQLPRKVLNLHIIGKTVGKFVELPPFVTTVKDLVTKVTTLFKDIKTSVMNPYSVSIILVLIMSAFDVKSDCHS